ncbi:solute carrier family 28 member 3-like [Pomacea canaliculata]|uniref:solute carrier family 28 member 3-like n=1 Tax=Pomacea canaliculata TaxID=400727 RepID=UPI000D739D23|nr:solute carrier family 28 member 3-like [Pomacea canaliculata]XP_025093355.1 solute carrier family 28 member 3-like [Pomacea canaliculata]
MAELTEYKPHESGETNFGYQNHDEDAEKNQVYTEVQPPENPGSSHPQGRCSAFIGVAQRALGTWVKKNRRQLIIGIKAVVFLLYFAYFGYAMYYRFGDEGSIRLLACTVLGVLILLLSLTSDAIIQKLGAICASVNLSRRQRAGTILRWVLYVLMAGFAVIFVIVDIALREPRNLMSLTGMAFFVIVLYITSTDPARVNWHPVFWGMSLQYIFALLIIRTTWGYDAFQWLGDRVTELLKYSNAGAQFVFGDKYTYHMFAFQVLPVIVYFSSLISVLYYLGVMQSIIGIIGRFLAFCLDTSATESLNAAGNIFVGQTESPLLIRPFMETMTRSQLHAVMTGGFATVSGSVLGAYVSYGVNASYLLGASVMSAPAALAISKLTCPETEVNKIDEKEVYKMEAGSSHNVIEAASSGASTAIQLVANVAVNVMAFLAILEFFNATLVWFGDRVGVDGLTFQFLCSYVFYPMAFLMGVDTQDCRRVAQLIGYKTFTNEFVAYIEMGKLLDNGKVYSNYTATFGPDAPIEHNGLDVTLTQWGTVLIGGFLTARSELITTYALCGFSNLGSMGIQLGGLGAMAPNRKTDLSRLVLRAMIAGNVACFMTACIAGLFFNQR